MKIKLVGFEGDPKADEAAKWFDLVLRREGLEGVARLFSPVLRSRGDGLTLEISARDIYARMFGPKSITLESFLTKYASPDDLAACNRVAKLRELYDTLYKPRLP